MSAKKVSASQKSLPSTTVSGEEDYQASHYLAIAKKRGNATKQSTVKSGGRYAVNFHLKNGASVATTTAYLVACGMKVGKEVSAEKMMGSLKAITTPNSQEDKVFKALLKHYRKETGADFNNLSTLINRIKSSISQGATRVFVPAEDSAADSAAALALVANVK